MQLLERGEDLAVLRDAVRGAADRRGCVVLLAGEAGIGKSTLVGAFMDDPGADARILTGWCDDLLTSRTYGPLRDVARQVGGQLSVAIEASDTSAVTEAMFQLLDDPLRPSVLVLEDVHWADEATLDIIRLIGRRIAARPAVLVLSYRDTDLGPNHPLRGVIAALPPQAVRRLRLHPLTRSAVAELLRGTELDPDEVIELTGGNPFFVSEVASQGKLPASVTDAVLGRLLAMTTEGREAVELLSVMPRAFSRQVALELVADPGALTEAETRGLLGGGATIGFRHELARRAVVASLPVTTRVRHHDRVLEHLLAGEGDPPAILHHAVGAGRAEVVAAFGPQAVRTAYEAGANRESAAHAEQVLRYAHLLEDEQRAEVLWHQSWALFNVGRFDDAKAAAEEAVEIRERTGPLDQYARALVSAARMSYMANDPHTAGRYLGLGVGLRPELDDPETTAIIAVSEAGLGYLLGDIEAALAAAEEADRLLGGLDRPDLGILVGIYRGASRLTRGDLGGLEELRGTLTTQVSRWTAEPLARAHTNLVTWLVELRRWEEARRAIDAALEFYADHDFEAHRVNTLGTAAWIDVLCGDWETALERIGSLTERGVLQIGSLAATSLIAVRRGEEDASALVERAWEAADRSGAPWLLLPVAAAAVELAWSVGEPGLADRYLTAAEEAQVNRWRDWTLWRGHVLLDRPAEPSEMMQAAERASVEHGWEAGAATWAEFGMPYEQALDLIRSGEVEPTLEGLAILDRLGAEPAARIARQRLRELGVTSIPRGPQASTRENPLGLTDRQLEVLDLLAMGLTNAEIADRLVVSVRTVDHHVSAILQKLGVESRQEATELAGSLDRS